MDLEEKFKKETGVDAYADNNLRPKVPSDYYVEWLEKQLALCNGVKSLPIQELPNCTRVEVIDQKGRSYVNWKLNNKVRLSMQDDGRTAKIFID